MPMMATSVRTVDSARDLHCSRQSLDYDDACECRVSSGLRPNSAVASVNTLAVV